MKMAKKRVATLSNKWEYCNRTGRKRLVAGQFPGWTEMPSGILAEADPDLWGLAGGVQSPVFTVSVTKGAHDDLSSNWRVTDFFAREENIVKDPFPQHPKSCSMKFISKINRSFICPKLNIGSFTAKMPHLCHIHCDINQRLVRASQEGSSCYKE